jgi:glycosyltransferase involved in cell wall biosynthesis
MYKDRSVGVVVPAYNEEKLIGRVIETMPEFVDKIVVVDDCSSDGTVAVVERYKESLDGRLELIRLEENQGVGGAIGAGYRWCRDHELDATAVMAGDAQMDPADLTALLDPVVSDQVDYAKGNRLITGEAWEHIPHVRYLGNAAMSLLTKIASGYWHVADSQTGYTVANLRVLQALDPDGIYKRYGMPNDVLVKLNIHGFRVRDVRIRPIYGIGEASGIKPLRMMPKLAWLLFRLFGKRLVRKYIILDFHPLVFFYGLASFLLMASIPLAGRMFYKWLIIGTDIPRMNALALFFCLIAGLQSLFFAMLFDMEYNKHLR